MRGMGKPSLVVEPDASEQQIALAADALESSESAVVLEGIATLAPGPDAIECRITEPMRGASRCEEEYKVLVENAARALRASPLGARLPARPLRWAVVDDDGTGTIELWREP
jgi:hypothetical protein